MRQFIDRDRLRHVGDCRILERNERAARHRRDAATLSGRDAGTRHRTQVILSLEIFEVQGEIQNFDIGVGSAP